MKSKRLFKKASPKRVTSCVCLSKKEKSKKMCKNKKKMSPFGGLFFFVKLKINYNYIFCKMTVRLSNELLIMIYKVSDMETKLCMNKGLKWSYKIYIDSMWNEVGYMRYIKK
jgi:hypothetical protein